MNLYILSNQVATTMELSVAQTPFHLDLKAPGMDVSLKYIVRLGDESGEGDELHICSDDEDPTARPVAFQGPGYLIMSRGRGGEGGGDAAAAAAAAAVPEDGGEVERLTGFLNELTEAVDVIAADSTMAGSVVVDPVQNMVRRQMNQMKYNAALETLARKYGAATGSKVVRMSELIRGEQAVVVGEGEGKGEADVEVCAVPHDNAAVEEARQRLAEALGACGLGPEAGAAGAAASLAAAVATDT